MMDMPGDCWNAADERRAIVMAGKSPPPPRYFGDSPGLLNRQFQRNGFGRRVLAVWAVVFGTIAAGAAQANTPTAPQNLSADPGSGSVTLSWDAPSSHEEGAIEGYNVEYTKASLGWDFANSMALFSNAGTITTDIDNLTNGTPYNFRVNAGSDGPWSETAQATPLAELAEAPARMSKPGTSRYSGLPLKVKVTWTAPDDGGSAITGYDLRYKLSSADWDSGDTVVLTDLTGTQTDVTSVSVNMNYDLQVRAKNAIGEGSWSPSQMTTWTDVLEVAPTITGTYAYEKDGSIRVVWKLPKDHWRYLTYDLDIAIAGEDWDSGPDMITDIPRGYCHDPCAAITVTADVLEPGVRYAFRVRAENHKGDGPWSEVVEETAKGGVPSAPGTPDLELGAASVGITGIDALWGKPDSGKVSTYDLDVAVAGEAWGAEPTHPDIAPESDGGRALVTGLTNGVRYAFRVRGTNSFGDGSWSKTSEIVMISPPSPMAAPTIVTGWHNCAQGGGCVDISWAPPADNGGADIANYRVIPISGGKRRSGVDVAATKTSLQIYGLPQDGEEFRFAVRAKNTAGLLSSYHNSNNWSDAVGPVTLEIPGAPAAPELVAGWDGIQAVRWAPPSAENGGTPYLFYDLDVAVAGQGWASGPARMSGLTKTSTYKGNWLDDGVRYAFRVRAMNSAGTGPWSATSEYTVGGTDELEIPQPGKPTAESGDGEIRVEWKVGEVSGIDGMGYFLGGNVQYVVAGQDWSSAQTVNKRGGGPLPGGGHYGYTVLRNLDNGVRYAFRVRHAEYKSPYRKGPWSAVSEAVAGGESEDAPDMVGGLTLAAGDGEITASWSAPTYEGGSSITGYEVEYGVDGAEDAPALVTVTETTAVLTGLEGGTLYAVRVRAKNSFGDGAWSESVTASPEGDAQPSFEGVSSPELNFTAGLEIDPEALPSATGGDGELGYTVSPEIDNGLSFDAAARAITGTPGSAAPAVTYTLTATDADGDTAELTFTITVTEADVPANVSAAATAATAWKTLDVQFDAPAADPDRVLANTQYRVLGLKQGASWTGWRTLTGVSETGGRVSGSTKAGKLAIGRVYEVQLRFCGATPSDANCGSASAGVHGATPASAPTNATASATDPASETALTLGWGIANTGGNKNMHAAYELGYSSDTDAAEPATLVDSADAPAFGETKAEISGLQSGTEYRLFVRSIIAHEGARLFASPWASATATTEAAEGLTLGEAPDDPQWTAGEAVEALILPEATGGTGAITYSLDPATWNGLSFDAATRELSGTPEDGGSSELTYTATDEAEETATLTFTVTVAAAAPSFDGVDSPALAFTAGEAIEEVTLPAAAGGEGALSYGLSPALDNGLAFDAATRKVSGIPEAAAEAVTYTLTATDENAASAELDFTIAVTEADTSPSYEGADSPALAFTAGEAVTPVTLPAASGGTGALTYTVAPALGNGLAFDAATRQVSGTPTAAADAASYTLTAADTDGDTADLAFTVTVTEPADTTAPTVTLATADGVGNPAVGAFGITIAFSEPVTGFAAGDLTVASGAASGLAGSDASWTATITPDDGFSGDVTVDMAAGVVEDVAGNGNEAASTLAVAVVPPVTKPTNVESATTAATAWKSLDVTFDAPPAWTGWVAANTQIRVLGMKNGAVRTGWKAPKSVSVENGRASASTGASLAVGRVYEVELRYCGVSSDVAAARRPT